MPHYGPASQDPDDKAAYKDEKYEVRQQIRALQERIADLGGDPYAREIPLWKWVVASLLILLFGPYVLSLLVELAKGILGGL